MLSYTIHVYPQYILAFMGPALLYRTAWCCEVKIYRTVPSGWAGGILLAPRARFVLPDVLKFGKCPRVLQ